MLAALCALRNVAWGHPPVATAAIVNITDDGQVIVTVYHDALAFALNDTSARIADREMYALLDGPRANLEAAFADGLDRFRSGFHLTVNGVDVPFEVAEFPSIKGVVQWKSEHSGPALPCKMDFVVKAKLPDGAQTMSLRLPEILADTVVVVHRPGKIGRAHV